MGLWIEPRSGDWRMFVVLESIIYMHVVHTPTNALFINYFTIPTSVQVLTR